MRDRHLGGCRQTQTLTLAKQRNDGKKGLTTETTEDNLDLDRDRDRWKGRELNMDKQDGQDMGRRRRQLGIRNEELRIDVG